VKAKYLAACLGCVALFTALFAPVAQADFGIEPGSFKAQATELDGTTTFQAGSHPYEYTVAFAMNRNSEDKVEGTLGELYVNLPPGLVGNPQALPRCSRADFDFNYTTTCPANTQVGVADIDTGLAEIFHTGVYNLTPSPGSPVTLGLSIDNNNSLQEASVRSDSDFGATVSDVTVPTRVEIHSVTEHIWGVPMAPSHDADRLCIPGDPELAIITGCSSDADSAPFLTLPTSCSGPLETTLTVFSVEDPTIPVSESVLSESEGTPFGMDGCNQLEFNPTISSQPTTNLADSPSGLDFDLHVPQPPAVKQEAGQPESCGVGHWEGTPTAFAYRWLRNGAPIPGAEASEYVTEEADAGTVLQCEVTATNAAGKGHAVSPPTVIAPAPATAPPSAATPTVAIKGSGVGEVASCDPGAWGGEPTFSYQWFKNGALVSGQNAATYLNPGPPSYTLQCEVSATNAGGAAVAFSANALSDPAPSPALPDSTVSPQANISESALPLATAPVKDTEVALPQGMTLNPSAGNGLSSCSEQQIGYLPGAPGVHFTAAPQSCPDAAKIGTLEASSPLLDHKVNGAVYVADPYKNPFGSLAAIYLAVEDPQTGIFAKLAGKATLDPQSGQITTTVTENPQLPLEDVVLHLFGGPKAALKTPLACGTYTTSSTLVPWSAPEGADAHPSDSFQTAVAAGGSGACPTSEAAAPNNPAFSAGTLTPQAGAYSPFVLKLNRPDGSQQLTGLDMTLPKGLTAKLAGIPYCSEAQIAVAKSREAPNQGAVERSNPSCPLASEVGTLTVGAGAGITPLYVGGRAYLAGPYKGAPLSIVIITPAVAGPFDLGAVVVRTALQFNSETAEVHAVSDPLPTIIQGIPLDLRSVSLRFDRPSFVLNPTSCNPKMITGTVSTIPGQSAPLSSRFQVGGCSALKFKPKLAISLKGGTARTKHPALKAVLTYPQGSAYANTARAQVNLPHSEFLDTTHIKTICTRVQFAAKACPRGSIYGFARAFTPLLDKPLEGPAYLRSSNHELPDLVIALSGQVDFNLVGRVDTGPNDGIRTTFDATPDAPVSKVLLEMQGGKKGLFVNSENLCRKSQRAIADFTAQNGKILNTRPLIANSCKGAKKKGKRQR
jgi:hypothetical protein